MSAHAIHLDIVYARPVDASGEAVLTLTRTLVATHQDHTALFIALACFGFTTSPGMSVATLALILYFLLAQKLLWASILKTSYLVLMTLRTSHLYFNSTHCGADSATFVPTLMTTRKCLLAALRTRQPTSRKNVMLNIVLLVALSSSAVSAVHFDQNPVHAFS